jgi:hypothetical protein
MSNEESLRKWKTEELERGIYSGSLDPLQKYQAERILWERFLEPDRKRARRLFRATAWAVAFSLGTFILALMIYWHVATGG